MLGVCTVACIFASCHTCLCCIHACTRAPCICGDLEGCIEIRLGTCYCFINICGTRRDQTPNILCVDQLVFFVFVSFRNVYLFTSCFFFILICTRVHLFVHVGACLYACAFARSGICSLVDLRICLFVLSHLHGCLFANVFVCFVCIDSPHAVVFVKLCVCVSVHLCACQSIWCGMCSLIFVYIRTCA